MFMHSLAFGRICPKPGWRIRSARVISVARPRSWRQQYSPGVSSSVVPPAAASEGAASGPVPFPANKTLMSSTSQMNNGRLNLIGLTRDDQNPQPDLASEVEKMGMEPYRAEQLWRWIYGKGVFDTDHMLTFSKEARKMLKERVTVDIGEIKKDQSAEDGTRKWLINFNGQEVETVFIPDHTRGTVCVSSQVGCTLSCTFCHTGTQKIVRNLTAGEIVSQILQARSVLFDFPGPNQRRVVTNIVFMGQGEPLYNFRNLLKALSIICDPSGISIGKSKVIVSTSGIVPNIPKLGAEFPGIGLAVSLHAVTDELRDQIVPINRQYPIKELLAACRAFPGAKANNKIAFEYVMLKGVNDSDADAKQLARLIQNIPSFVNIIPFNAWPGAPYECSSNERISQFAKTLMDAGAFATVRWPRGRDILAACGQLRTTSTKTGSTNSNSSASVAPTIPLSPTGNLVAPHNPSQE